MANQFKTLYRQASKIGSRVIKKETSRSSSSAFILSPEAFGICAWRPNRGLVVASLRCYLNASQGARSFSGLLNLTNSKERAKSSWSLRSVTHNGQTNLSAGTMLLARRTLRLVQRGGNTKCGLTVFFECLQINEVLSQPVTWLVRTDLSNTLSP